MFFVPNLSRKMNAWNFLRSPQKSRRTAVRHGFSPMPMQLFKPSHLNCAAEMLSQFFPTAASAASTKNCRRAFATWREMNAPLAALRAARIPLWAAILALCAFDSFTSLRRDISYTVSLGHQSNIWLKCKSCCRLGQPSTNCSCRCGTRSIRFAISPQYINWIRAKDRAGKPLDDSAN